MPYVTLTNGEYSSLLSFIFGFGKESFSSFLLLFLVYEYEVLLFLLLLFVLKERSALYHLESFYNTDFHIPILVHVLYKIYVVRS